jgi:hypothetical protein
MKTVAEVIGVSRSNLVERLQGRPKKRIGRPPLPGSAARSTTSRWRSPWTRWRLLNWHLQIGDEAGRLLDVA